MTPPYRFDDPLVTRLCQELELAMCKIGVITTAHYENDPRAHIAAALNGAWSESESSAMRRAAEDEETVERVARAIQQAGDECYGNGMNVKDACDKLSRAALAVLIPSSPSAESDNG